MECHDEGMDRDAVTYWNDIHDGGKEAPEKAAE